MSARYVTRVAGVSFVDGYPDNITALNDAAVAATLRGECLPALLVRNPDNPYDAKAIEVHAPTGGGMIGHLPRHVAARMAPRIDGGETIAAEITAVVIHPDHPDRPGIDVACWRVDAEGVR